MTRFRNRAAAGKLLAHQLGQYAGRSDVLVLALPRGGVPVAFEVSTVLQAPLDLCLVRKLGAPGDSEVAIGAIASGGVQVLNQELLDYWQISDQTIAEITAREIQELHRREVAYRGDRPLPQLQNRVVILVDDGLATGSTMLAAIDCIGPQQPQQIVVAIPVAPLSTCYELAAKVDRLCCLMTPSPFGAIGRWYEDFSQTSDAEVCKLLMLNEVFGRAY